MTFRPAKNFREKTILKQLHACALLTGNPMTDTKDLTFSSVDRTYPFC